MSGSDVAALEDRKNSANVATSPSTSSRPILGTINGVQCLDYSVRDTRGLREAFSSTITQQNFIIGVIQPTTFGYLMDSTSSSNRQYIRYQSERAVAWAGRTIFTTESSLSSEVMMINARFNSTASNVELNGGEVVVGDAGTRSLAGVVLGSNGNDATMWGELIILDRNPGTIEREKLQGYLAHKWGIADKLPSDHPYKVNAPTL